jgi:PAS domain S-box-containing protein
LLELQDFTQDIIHSMRGGLLTTDGEGRIVVLNRTGEEILEKTFHELRGVSLCDWNSDFWLPRLMTGKEKAGLRKEIDYRTPSGKQRFLGISVSLLRSRESGRSGYGFNFQDLTDLRRLEQEVAGLVAWTVMSDRSRRTPAAHGDGRRGNGAGAHGAS